MQAKVKPNGPASRFMNDPCLALWNAVIEKALHDACNRNISLGERDRARCWFFSDHPAWLHDFQQVCDLAGLDWEWVRSVARKRISESEREGLSDLAAILFS